MKNTLVLGILITTAAVSGCTAVIVKPDGPGYSYVNYTAPDEHPAILNYRINTSNYPGNPERLMVPAEQIDYY